MPKVFFSYSHDDEQYRDQLEAHLASLKHEGLIESWHDRRLLAGGSLDNEIDQQINAADIILLLVSASFLNSRYCYSIEMSRALERHQAKEAWVVPVIVRPCDWHSTPLGGLLAAPKDGKAITTWPNFDEAYVDVARQIRLVISEITTEKQSKPVTPKSSNEFPAHISAPRSSNLRLRKTFTDLEIDEFRHESFDFIARFFESSLAELQLRNPGIEGRFRRIDTNTFTAAIYRNGSKAAECQIRHGGGLFGNNAITYSNHVSTYEQSFNEIMTVDQDEQALFLKPSMLTYDGKSRKLTQEGAAESFWTLLISPLQR
ncbi:toll/interleukin-1 receptor domain-containing protein [Pseudomonas sp.]|uniref:toll/interleukin-1 receptor domain-containing protein n=1 Tax=Pseudomonas sp. TaxID=306 RepID=UPI0028A6148C|nr:toll/interleukin-1 receptor domain-containing protein [Pseudomonas sp.]